MKTWIKDIIKTMKSVGQKPVYMQKANQQNSNPFEPAPSYWALIPVKVEILKQAKQKREE